MSFFYLVTISFMLGTLSYVLRRYYVREVQHIYPFIPWALRALRDFVDYWEFKRKYKEPLQLLTRLTMLVASSVVHSGSLRDDRKQVTSILYEMHDVLHPGKPVTDAEKEVVLATYVTAISHQEIMETLASVQDGYKTIDLVKATTLCIDILGELIHLEDELGREYFQHLIYGINKSLKVIRDNGTDPRTMKRVSTTLFRVYKLTKAYRTRRRLQGMKAGEVYDKIISLLEHVTYVVTIK